MPWLSDHVALKTSYRLQASDKFSHRETVGSTGRILRTPNGNEDIPLFAGNMQGGLSNKYAGDPHLKEPLDARYRYRLTASIDWSVKPLKMLLEVLVVFVSGSCFMSWYRMDQHKYGTAVCSFTLYYTILQILEASVFFPSASVRQFVPSIGWQLGRRRCSIARASISREGKWVTTVNRLPGFQIFWGGVSL